MQQPRLWIQVLFVSVLSAAFSANAASDVSIEDLQKQVEDLRHQLLTRAKPTAPITQTELTLDKRFGPDAEVTTKSGKLVIGGLLQLWDVRIQNDNEDIFGNKHLYAKSGGTSNAIDNDTSRIRRAQLRFTMDVTENITGYVMIDPANEMTSFPNLPTNQGLFKSVRENPSIANGSPIENTSVGRVQTGAGRANADLEDAYIRVHGLLPHHDFVVGQFRPKVGEEGPRDDSKLDFAERAMITQNNAYQDLGLQAHGTWLEDRFQYWAAVLDGAGNFFNTAGSPAIHNSSSVQSFGNRSDDNRQKDVLGSVQFRPIWDCGKIGSLEFGYSNQYGDHGNQGDSSRDGSAPTNGLNRDRTAADRQAAWLYYKPMGVFHGLALRGEWGEQRDRTVPLSVDAFGLGSGPFGEQAAPRPITRTGFYGAWTYRLSESVFGERLSHGGFFNDLLQPVEFKMRYEEFQNIVTESLVQPDIHSDLFRTKVLDIGVNYYKDNMKVQMEFMVVDEKQSSSISAVRNFHEVANNVFMFSYQIAF